MKVLGVVILHPLRKINGAITAAHELSREISKFMPYTLAMMWDENEYFKENGLEVFRFRSANPLSLLKSLLPRWTYIPLYSSSGIAKFIMETDFDVVHIHGFIPAFAMKTVADTCLRKGIPYCISSHGFTEFFDYARINKFGFIKRILNNISMDRPLLSVIKNAAWIFTLSPHDDELLKRLNFPKERSLCVTNGVRQVFLKPPLNQTISNLSEKLGLTEDRNPKLLFVGSLYPYKGVDTFLNTLHHIPYPVTAIVGGKFKTSSERENLLRRTNASLLTRHKLIFTGWLTDMELRSLYHIADVFIYPTRGDSLPLTILEAMACKLSIVSTKIGGIPFQLANGAGFVTEPDDVKTIAQIVIRLIEDPDLRVQTGSAARKRVDDLFGWDKAAQAAIKGYKRINEFRSKDTAQSS